MTQNKNPFHNIFATLAASAVFVCQILQLFAPKAAFLRKSILFFR
jgi:hypothetical protein